MKVLELINVRKDYKLANKEKFTALSEINVSFEKGELVSIIGESGSGKSTLMNLIGGLDSDYEGIINIDGKDLKNFKDKQLDDYRKKKIGFVFQSFNLIPHLSILENVTIPLTLSNIKEGEKNEKAIKLLTKLGLGSQIKKKPTQLSGGQKQRVAIARALINDPDIILADEPTGSLDTATTGQILEILKEIADDGKLVIMVTHSEKVAKISSRIVEISDGKIIKDEKKEDYKASSKNEKIVEKSTQNQNLSRKNKKEKHLSLLSALKLSFRSMWASKTKNILMAVGVSISLIAMILMLSFGSGLTGYITSTAQNYSSPTIVSISKSGYDKFGNKLDNPPMEFTDYEINELLGDNGVLNTYLDSKSNSFNIINQGENRNTNYGITVLPINSSISGAVTYTPEVTQGETPQSKTEAVMCTYSTPPYYNEANLLTKTGRISGENEIMLSKAALKLFGLDDDNIEEAVGKKVTFAARAHDIPFAKEVTVTGIVDISLFSSFLVIYIDYDFLNDCVKEAQEKEHLEPTGLSPTQLYINTDSEQTCELIKSYIKKNRKDLTGSVEEQLEGMFNEMLSTFSIALTVISGISLAVALIMIMVVLYMSVSERTREIGVLKSIGARKKDIRLIFSTESFLVGLFSGIFGVLCALACGGIFTLVFNSLLGFAPIKMLWQYFAEALVISVIISILAGLYPSSKAARLDPVESLRHE